MAGNHEEGKTYEHRNDSWAADNYRTYCGPLYDVMGSIQLTTLVRLGLREWHSLLDIGCGSLRAGRHLMTYLLPGNYVGIDPNAWLWEEAIENELCEEFIEKRGAEFFALPNFEFAVTERTFDYFLASSIFSHASLSQIHTCIDNANLVRKPDSIFVGTFVEGEEDYTGDEWVYPPNGNVVTYTWDTISNAFTERGWRLIRRQDVHPNGQRWFVAKVNPYRTLKEGEVTEEGDEHKFRASAKWAPLPEEEWGKPLPERRVGWVRRPT